MISWLLVAVLLFAVNAITTPTSTLAEPRFTSTPGPAVTLRKQTGDNRDKGSPLSAVDGPGLAQSHNGTSTIVGPSPDGPASLSRGGDHLAAISAGNLSIFNHQVGQAADTVIDSAQSRHRNRSEATSWAPTQPVSEQRTFSPGATSNRSDEDGASKRGTPLQEQQSQPDTSSKSAPESQQRRQKKVYTNQFVIKVEGGEEEARRVAEKHGFIYLNHIIDNFYHLEHRRLAKRSLDAFDMDSLDVSIEEEPNVLTFERQLLKRRVKRDFIDLGTPPPPGMGRANQLRPHPNGQQRQTMQALRPAARPAGSFLRPANQAPFGYQQHAQLQAGGALQHAQDTRRPQPYQQLLDQLEMNSSGPAPFFAHANHSGAANINKHRPPPPPIQMSAPSAELQRNNQTFHYANDTRRQAPFNDPSWPLMWYLDGGARNGFDLNVQAAWRMGYTGRGIVITILDDGLEKDHPDLQANYDPMASFDINGDDADPMPRYDSSDSNRHGTRCAGEVAAVPNNNICSIGIAYNSKVGGVRMLDGEVTDAVEARSLRLNNQHIHIYSASWGPDDNGKTVDGPGELATRAFVEGVTRGRGGRGSIFVFASGNGGREHDNCNCDGYTNSIWTLSISSASENGFVPWYIEACSSTLATTYSSGSFDERQIATTDIRHSCTNNHTGTSASAPIAAGICALVLEANPELTWRDMQHIVVRTAKPANLVARDWRTNAMGRNVSHAFGYGLMDAAAMILMAKRWRNVPDAYTCLVEAPRMEKHIQSKGVVEIKLRVECSKIHFIEHVQAVITLTAVRRGDLHIYLTSPLGTRSTLLAQRPMDIGEQGFRKWPFMTVHNWGEPPNGIWTLEVHNDGKPPNRATLREWNLTLYGTEEDPNMNTDFSYLSNQQQPSFMSAAHPQTTTTTSPTTTTSTSTTPSPREQIKTQHSIGNQPPAPSFSPTDYDMQTGRPAVNRKPIVSISGDMQTMVQSSPPPPPPPPPPVGHKVPAVSRPIDTTPSTTTASSRQQQLFSQTVAPATTSTSSSVSSSTTTIATSSEVQYENAKQTPESEILTPKTNKADFEVVAPPTIAVGNQHHSPDPFLASNRPQIQVMDGNKIDASQTGGRPFAPEVVRATTPRPFSGQPQPTPNQNEFDTNQLDAKFTKDYRSSGGGSLQDVPYEEDDTRQNGADSTLSGKAADPLNRQRPSAAKDRSNSAPLAGVSVSVHFFGLLIGCLFVLDRQRRIESPFRAVSAR